MTTKKSVLFIAFAFATFFTVSAQVPGYVPTNGLVGWWPFNGNANDESGGGNHGVTNGTTLIADRNNLTNKAYQYNGVMNNFISVAGSNLPVSSSAISISAWFNMYSYPGNSSIAVLGWGQWTTNNARYIGFRQATNNQLTYAQYYNDVNCTFGYALNTWYHYVVTYSNNVAKFYVNSTLQGTFSISTPNTLAGPLYFGKSPGNTDYITGALDDIGIWNRALDSAEISKLYKAVVNTTGIQQNTSEKNIRIFPNPANDRITVDFNNDVPTTGLQLKIINSLGQDVLNTHIGSNNPSIDLPANLSRGIYFLQIIDNRKNLLQTTKLVVN